MTALSILLWVDTWILYLSDTLRSFMVVSTWPCRNVAFLIWPNSFDGHFDAHKHVDRNICLSLRWCNVVQ